MPKNTRPGSRRPGQARKRPGATPSAHLGNRALMALHRPFTEWLARATETEEEEYVLGPEDVVTVIAESVDWLLKRSRTTQVGPETATRWTADDMDLLLFEMDSPTLAAFGQQRGLDDDDLVDAVADSWELFLLFLQDTKRWTGTEEDLEECLAALDDSSAAELAIAAADDVSDEEEDAALAALPLTAQVTALLDGLPLVGVAPDQEELLQAMAELELVVAGEDGIRPGPAAATWREGSAEEVRQLRRDLLSVWVLEGCAASQEEDETGAVPAMLVAVITSGMVDNPLDAEALAELLPDEEDSDIDPEVVVPAVTALTVRLTAAGVFPAGGPWVAPRGLWPALANVVIASTGHDDDEDHEHDHDHDHEGHDGHEH